MADSEMGEAVLERKQAVYRNLVTSLISLIPCPSLRSVAFLSFYFSLRLIFEG
jgi:hypothetical protein